MLKEVLCLPNVETVLEKSSWLKQPTDLWDCVKERLQVGFWSTVNRNGSELSLHAQVLSNHSHQRHAGDIHQPPGQGRWKMGVINPAADHVEKVYSDREIQTLFPTSDKKPKTESAADKK